MIYPGSIVFKRIKHGLVLSTITLAIYINQIQDILIKEIVQLMEEAQKFIPTAQFQVKTIEDILPLLEKLEDSKFGYLFNKSSLPNTIELKKNIRAVQNVGEAIPNILPSLKLTGQILKYTSIFLALQIAFSLFWMGMDLKKGKQKLWTLTLLIVAILINYEIHEFLNSMNLLT